ncbi:MAG: 2-oxo acid dehydrogenase subunit E2 [Phycisphaeraceae bacterium]|nr:2-oxo acid dehydrogenase subunit E2 [Phycisphaeraceae bacterium]
MSVEFKVPELGDGIESADILDVLVSPGDTIEKEQGVVEVETDKATMEIPSSVSGKVKDVKVDKGQSVKVGQVLITVEEEDGSSEDADEETDKDSEDRKKDDGQDKNKSQKKKESKKKKKTSSSEKSGSKTREVRVPELGDGVESADVLDVLVSPGDTIEKDQGLIEAETEKATMEVPSPTAGKVVEVKVEKGDTIQSGQVLITVEAAESEASDESDDDSEDDREESESKDSGEGEDDAEKAAPREPEKETLSAPASSKPAKGGPVAAAPSVRKFAREIGINIHQVTGTGPSGRISIEDVKDYARQHGTGTGKSTRDGGASAEADEVTVEAMSKLRKVSAAHLSESWEAPHVTLQSECDVSELEEVRQAFKKKAEASGGKLTVTAMFIKIVSAALKVYPRVNASLDLDKGEFHLKNRYNIGCAVDTPRGLVVPVIRNVDQKNILQIAGELTEISAKARDGKLTPDEMKGGTFTVTNLGGLGIGFFTPIINHPEVAILGMGRATMKPVWEDGEFKPKLMLPLSLSFDHRIIDGADGARFLKWLVDAVENPLLLSMEG